MWSPWALRCCYAVPLSLLLAAVSGVAQKPASSSSGTVGAAAPKSTNTPNSSNNPLGFPGTSSRRPVFFDGAVQLDDGSKVSMDVRIERVCGGSTYLQAHPDSKGHFSFQLGNTTALDTDASDASPAGSWPGMGGGSANSAAGSSLGSSGSRIDVACEIRASYPGYRSDVYNVSVMDRTENIHVGTLVLHRLAAVQGTTISVTTALAPKKAQKDYEKGLQLSQKGDIAAAEEHLQKAVALYPKYAVAWSALGDVQQRQNRAAEARTSYEKAISCDSRYVTPYDQLARLAGQESKWQESVDYSKRVIDLNPVEFLSAYWYSAVGNFHLQHWTEAEKSGRALLKLDTAHQYPQAEHLVGFALLQSGNFSEAADHMRAYLRDSPHATDAEAVKKLLAQLDTKPGSARP